MLPFAIVASGLSAGVCLIGAEFSDTHVWLWEVGFAASSVVFAVLAIRAAMGSARTAIGGEIHTLRRAWSKLLPMHEGDRQDQNRNQNNPTRSSHF